MRCLSFRLSFSYLKMGKNKDRKKKGAGVQKTVTKAKKNTEKELKKQIEQLGEVKFIFFKFSWNLFFFTQENIEQLITKHVGKDNTIDAVIIDEPSENPPSRR